MEVVGEHLSGIMELLEGNMTRDQQELASAEMEALEHKRVWSFLTAAHASSNNNICL